MTLSNKLLKNSFWMFSSKFLGTAISYILIVLIARQLGAAGIGQFSFVIAFVSFAFIFGDFGLSYLIIRDISRNKKLSKEYIPNIMGLQLVSGIIIFLILILTAASLDKSPTVINSLIIYGFTAIIITLSNPFFALIQAHEHMKYTSIADLIERVIALFVAGYLLFNGYSILWVFLAILISFTIKTIFVLWVGSRFEKVRYEFKLKIWSKLIKKSLPFMLSGLAMFIYFRIDTIMLSLIVGDQATGWYNAAYRFIELFIFIPYVISVVLLPSMSQLYKQNVDKMRKLVSIVYKYLILLAIPICVGTFLIANRLILFIYDSGFLPHSALALQVLIWAELFIFLNFLLGNILNAIDKQKIFTLITGICAGLNVVFNLILIPQYSYIGAGIATVITQLICMILLYHQVKRNLVVLIFKRLWKCLVAVVIMSIVIYHILNYHVLIIILLAVIVYFGVIYLLGLDESDRLLIQSFRNLF